LIIGLVSDEITQEILEELNEVQGFMKKKRKKFHDSSNFLGRYYNVKDLPSISIRPLNDGAEPLNDANPFNQNEAFIPFPNSADIEESEETLDIVQNSSEVTLLAKAKTFHEQLERSPNDASIWLRFLNFQDEALKALDISKGKSSQSVSFLHCF